MRTRVRSTCGRRRGRCSAREVACRPSGFRSSPAGGRPETDRRTLRNRQQATRLNESVTRIAYCTRILKYRPNEEDVSVDVSRRAQQQQSDDRRATSTLREHYIYAWNTCPARRACHSRRRASRALRRAHSPLVQAVSKTARASLTRPFPRAQCQVPGIMRVRYRGYCG